MKKMITLGAAIACTLVLGASTVLASDMKENATNTNQGVNYVDDNQDGVCDNKGEGKRQNFIDENKDGVCDRKGSGMGKGCRRNFKNCNR